MEVRLERQVVFEEFGGCWERNNRVFVLILAFDSVLVHICEQVLKVGVEVGIVGEVDEFFPRTGQLYVCQVVLIESDTSVVATEVVVFSQVVVRLISDGDYRRSCVS